MTARDDRRLRQGELALHALGKHKGNPKLAAQDQGVAVRTLLRRIDLYCVLRGFDTRMEAAYWLLPSHAIGQNTPFSTDR